MSFLGPEEEDPDCQSVGGQPHNKHDNVDHREENGCEWAVQDRLDVIVDHH